MTTEKFTKAPNEEKDIDVDFRPYLNGFTPPDIPAPFGDAYTVESDPGIIILSHYMPVPGLVKIWVKGGTVGEQYKIWVLFNTEGGRKKRGSFVVRVKG